VIPAETTEEEAKSKAMLDTVVLKHIAGRDVKKMIYVKNRLINIVV
jgi:leucyl-tRNA synthetase